MDITVTLILAIIGSGALSAGVTAFMSRKRTEAEASQITVQGAAVLSDATMRIVQYLEGELNQVRGALNSANQNATLMSQQLTDANNKHEEIKSKMEELGDALRVQDEQENHLVDMIRRLIDALFNFDPTSPLIIEAKTLIDTVKA
jgi:chromosome segregation ATPase